MIGNSQDLPLDELEEVGSSAKKGQNLRSLVKTLRRKAWLIIGLSSLTTIAGLAWSATDPHSYSGNFYLLVEPITSAAKLTDPTTLTRTGGVPQDDLFALDYPTNLVFLKSPGMTYRIAKDVHDKHLSKSVPAIWKDIRDNLTVERIGSTGSTATKIFEVSYTGENLSEVQTILETAAQTFLKYSAEDRETSLKAGVSFIDRQLPDLQQRLNKLQSQQQQLREKYELLDPSSKGQAVLLQIQEIEGELHNNDMQLKASKSLYTLLQQQLNFNNQEAIAASTLSQDTERIALLAKLQEVESQIALESARFTANSPILQNLEDQKQNILELLEQKTQRILQEHSISLQENSSALTVQNPTRLKSIDQLVDTFNQIQLLEIRSRSLAATKAALEKQSSQYPEVIRQDREIDRQIALTTQIIDRLQTQRETLKVETAQELPWQLISKPQIPLDRDGKPISYPPNRQKKILVGIASGLLVSVGLAVLLEKRRNIFYTAEDIKDEVPPPLLAEIPWDETSAINLPLVSAAESLEKERTPLENFDRVRSYAFKSAFDVLYGQLCFLYKDNPIRSLSVCSVEDEDGQTTVTVYLAQAAAATGKRVLLVDANWHDPQLHEWLNVSNYKGLYHLLTAPLNHTDVIQPVRDRPNLAILTSGLTEPEPQKRLWSTKMQEMMEKLETEYDLVIYELPHFFDSTDVSFITSRTDGMLLVVGVAKTDRTLVKKAIEELDKFTIPCIGIVAKHLSDAKPPLL